MSEVRRQPCEACPYRKDVPSGIWAKHEYEKLIDYDAPTGEQPIGTFMCHATPDWLCHGWAMCHENRGPGYELLALRMFPPEGDFPEAVVPLFESGQEAADHGMADIAHPSVEAQETAARLVRKNPRLEWG